MFKRKGIVFSVLCVLLGIITGAVGTLRTFAEASEPITYLQDIRIYQGGSSSGAQDYFNKTGYTMLPNDLNAGTGTGEKVYLGYKTTTDKSKALTDIRLMGMDTGYQSYDYKRIQEYLASQQEGTAQAMFSAAEEFAVNYDLGSPKALEAYKGLNLFDIGDTAKTKLGDYILSGKADKNFFVKLLVRSSAGAVNDVLGFLNIGIAPFENNYDMDTRTAFTANWAERISISSLWDEMAEGLTTDEEEDLHKQYNDLAKKLFSAFQDFAILYENAAARYDESKVEEDDRFKSVDEAVEQLDTIEQKDTDLLYIACYDTLNQYPFNDRFALGEWIVNIGKQTSDSVDIMQLYPVVEAMTDNQVEIVARTGLISAISNLSENTELTDYQAQIKKAKEAIKDYNNGASVSLWDVEGDDIENARIALTSDAIRKQGAEQSLGKSSDLEKFDEKFQTVMKWINIAIGAAFVLVGIAEITFKVCVFCAAAESAFSAFCVSALSIVSWLGIGLLIISAIVLVVHLIYALIVWIIELVEEKIKDLNHTTKPDFIFDAPETAQGSITVKYKSVRNDDGDVCDLNASKQYKWCLLATTTDTRVGSPIRADSNGEIFKIIQGGSNRQNGYDCARFFGERNPANTNAFCEEDRNGGIYLHYRSDSSIANEVPEGGSGGETSGNHNYIKDLIIAVGKNESEAKAKIISKEGKYYVLDANLTPGGSYATFVGYTMTTDKTKAVRDIRVQPYAGKPEGVPTKSGELTYNFVENIGTYVKVGDEQTRPQADALYYTKDEHAGTPILADGLHVVSSFDKVQPGWEPVALFGADYPYDFKTSFTTTDVSLPQFYSGYQTTQGDTMSKHTASYLYYEPETKYTSGTKYLSGFFFIGGRDYKKNDKNSQIAEQFQSLINDVKKIPNAVIIGGKDNYNIASTLNHSVDFGAGTGGYWINLVYTWTYNPNRAVYDAAVYQGTLFSDTLPYSLSKKNSEGAVLNYIACSFIGQQTYKYGALQRYIGTNNTFKDSGGVNFKEEDIKAVRAGHTATAPFAQNVKYGFNVSDYIATGFYVLGYTKNMNPLKLADVVITNKTIKGKSDGQKITYNVSGLKTLNGDDATGEFHSVYELKNPHNTTPFEFSYSHFFNSTSTETDPDRSGNGRQVTNLFVFLREAEPEKPRYISSLSVGTYSRAQYKAKNPKADNNTLKAVDTIVDGQALSGALAGCSDEVIYTNFAIANQNDAWYNKTSAIIQGHAAATPPENNVAAYIGVTRTNKPEKAIKGVLLYQINDTTAPETVKLENVDYFCAGVQAPIEMNGKTYFLYYTTNSGVSPCAPITDIMVDNNPMVGGYATNLSGDRSHDAPYGNPDQTNFIHLKYDKEHRNIFTKLFIGKGSNKRAALCDLLSQGCFECIDMDLNTGIEGNSIYMGFRSSHVDWDAINSKATEKARKDATDKALDEAVYDVLLTRGEAFKPGGFVSKDRVYYYPVSKQDLTDGKGDEIYMYYCCPYWSRTYNTKNGANTLLPSEAFTGYYKEIGMSNYDRVPYNTTLAGTDNSGNSIFKWEYVMFSDNSAHANPNAGTIAYSYDDERALDNRVNIFAQRSDNSVKPAGEITGGFVDEKMNVGTLKFTLSY